MRCKETESHYHHHHPAKEQDEKGEVGEGTKERRGNACRRGEAKRLGFKKKKKKMQSKKTEEGVRIFGKGRTEKVREGSEGENRDGIIKYE